MITHSWQAPAKMSESESVHADSQDGESTAGSNYTQTTSGFSSGVPLSIVPAYKHLQEQKSLGLARTDLPELPSQRFQYSVWHDLRVCSLKGTQLKAPRIREGPEVKERSFYKLKTEDDDQYIHHSLRGSERLHHRHTLEEWEKAKSASFCFQYLEHNYQKSNFYNVLGRLPNVEQLYLVDNELTSMSSFSYPKCEALNLNKNYLSSFKQLPSIPRIRYLTMENNDVNSFKGLGKFQTLEQLYLRGNPIYFVVNYRPKVFKILPNLQILDGIPRLPSDSEFQDEEDIPDHEESRCVIS